MDTKHHTSVTESVLPAGWLNPTIIHFSGKEVILVRVKSSLLSNERAETHSHLLSIPLHTSLNVKKKRSCLLQAEVGTDESTTPSPPTQVASGGASIF